MFCVNPKTAYEFRISDLSSDVCSSDLLVPIHHDAAAKLMLFGRQGLALVLDQELVGFQGRHAAHARGRHRLEENLVLDVDRGEHAGSGRCRRSEEPRVGIEGVSPSRSRWCLYHYTQTKKNNVR